MHKFLSALLISVLGSTIANIVILYILKPYVINPAQPLHALSVGPVVFLSVIGALGAVGLYALLRHLIQRPNATFIWISILVLIASFIPDYLIIGLTTGRFAGGTPASALTLALMHVMEAGICVWALTKVWGPKVFALK